MNMTFSTQLSTKAQDDFNLVQMAIAGDQRAYSELMSRYRSSVYHTILKMVNNVEDANDLTIEAFGKAFRKLHSYTPHYAFSTWLFRIAINNCIDYIRKKRINLLSIDETIEQESEQDYSSNIRGKVPTHSWHNRLRSVLLPVYSFILSKSRTGRHRPTNCNRSLFFSTRF
jgi:RNA polymerase sigma-70 factor (ECF subfamily)